MRLNFLSGFLVLALLASGCASAPVSRSSLRRDYDKSFVRMECTGYDSGKKSCNWKRDWLFRPVVASGPDKGKRKIVGMTASGEMAHSGTIAADTRFYPFGTVMYVPGYGWGIVEDRGGAIKGPNRLDLWFSSERKALEWGRQKNVGVTVWKKKANK